MSHEATVLESIKGFALAKYIQVLTFTNEILSSEIWLTSATNFFFNLDLRCLLVWNLFGVKCPRSNNLRSLTAWTYVLYEFLCFVLWRYQLYGLYNVKWYDDWWIGKGFEGAIVVRSRCYPGICLEGLGKAIKNLRLLYVYSDVKNNNILPNERNVHVWYVT